MKLRKSALILLTAAAFTVFYSCKKTATFDSTVCTGTTVSYSADVAPIISTYCNTGGCHAFTSYTSVKSSSSAIYSQVASGSMPRGTSLSATQKQKILCWINNGTLNN